MGKKKHKAKPAPETATMMVPLAPTTSHLGRKRKPGERYPSGRLKPETFANPGTAPAQIRRMVELARNKAADPVLATPIGWLHLHGILTTKHLAAAEEYGKLRGQNDRVAEMPRRSAASPSYDAGYGRAGISPLKQEIAEAIRARYDRMDAVMTAISLPLDKEGRPDERARSTIVARNVRRKDILDKVVVLGEHPSAWELEDLIAALDRIARHLRLTI